MNELSLIGLNYDELSKPGNVVPQKLFSIGVERTFATPQMFLVETGISISGIVAGLFVLNNGEMLARVDYPRHLDVVPCPALQAVDYRHVGVRSITVRLDRSLKEVYIPIAIQSGNPSIIYYLTSEPDKGLVPSGQLIRRG